MRADVGRSGAIRLEQARRQLNTSRRWRRYFSPLALSLELALEARLRKHALGDLLDVGCGTMPFRETLLKRVKSYESLDIEARAPGVTYLADVQAMPEVPTARYDSILCSEVLEHVARPDAAIAELFRVLRPGGRLLLTVPFLSRLHEEPHDFYRYTEHGLRELLGRHGFVVEEVAAIASVCSFLGHQVSTLVVAGTWDIPVLRELAFGVNLLAVVLPCYWLDRLVMPRRKLPAGYVAVAVKSGAPTSG